MTDEDEQIRREQAAIEAFDPSQPTRKIVFRWPDAGGNLHDHEFVQGPLGHFATIELGNILRKIIKDVMDGKYGVDVKELINDRRKLSTARMEVEHAHGDETHSHAINFGGMDADQIEPLLSLHAVIIANDETTTGEFVDASARLASAHEHVEPDLGAVYEQFKPYIEAFMQVLGEVPEIEQEIMALSLGVRRRDREEFKERISEAPHAGGLTNTEASNIIKAFIRQNAEEIRRFLGEELREIGAVFMDAIEGMVPQQESSTDSSGGKPSSTSSDPTPA